MADMKGNFLHDELQIPDFMGMREVRIEEERKEEEDVKETAKNVMAFIGLVGMCYSFLWIDAKPITAVVGMLIGTLIIIGGSK